MKRKLFITLICILAGQVMAIDLDGPWYTGSNNGTPYLSATDSSSFSWGQGEDGTATTAAKGMLWSYFPAQTLALDGDTITLEFSVTFDDDITGTSGTALRLGLFDNGGSILESNLSDTNSDPAFSSSTGYYAAWPVSALLSASVRSRTTANNNPLSTSGAVNLGSAQVTDALIAGVPYKASFSVVRISATEYEVISILNGVPVQAVSDNTNVSTFNSFYLLNTPGTGVGSMTFSDIKVLYNAQAHNPFPSSGQKGLETELTLQWNTGLAPDDPAMVNPAIKKHYLYMSTGSDTDPNLYFMDEIPATGVQSSYGPLTLSRDNTYLWMVEEGLDNDMGGVYQPGDPNNIVGKVWQFETLPSVPFFTTQPVSMNLKEGGDVIFTVEAVNPFTGDDSGMEYQWFKFVDGINDEQLTDGDKYIGCLTTTLTVVSVDINDEGSYYCLATITSTAKYEDSEPAAINLDRLIQHHKFDGDLIDSVGDNNGVSSNGDPNFVVGEINEAFKCFGTKYADIGMSGFPNASEGGGLYRGTIAMWFNSASTTQESLMGSLNTSDSTALNVQFRGNNRLRVLYRSSDGTVRQVEIDASTIRNDKWHHLILSYEAGPQTKLDVYIDGDLQSLFTLAGGNPTTFTDWEFSMTIGNLNNRGNPSNQYIGLIDDLRVYNYPFDDVDAAKLYTETRTGERKCPVSIKPAYDLNNDCQVDLLDLMELATEWLDCGVVPKCIP